MTQPQIDLFNAAEAALKEAESKLAELRKSPYGMLGELLSGDHQINQRAAKQAELKIDEAILWLREI